MTLRIRIASFNFENFFSRAILLNRDNLEAKPFLQDFAKLQREIEKANYDKPEILRLYKRLRKYVIIRENKGKLLSGATSKAPKVVARGRDDWEGFLELKRERVADEGQENTLRVLREVDADVVCVVEMEDRQTLEAAGRHDTFPTGKTYPHAMLIEGNDDRGIDVGVLSRFPIRELVSHVDDKDTKGVIFSRDCLEAQVALPGGRTLVILANHLKSQGYGTAASNDAKRLRQSKRIAKILSERYDLKKDYVVVAGDLNADREANNGASLRPIYNYPDLVDVLEAPGSPPPHWTYSYRGKKQRLDYLFCSKALARHLKGVGAERRGIWNLKELTGDKPFPQVKGIRTAASDHAAIFADFTLP